MVRYCTPTCLWDDDDVAFETLRLVYCGNLDSVICHLHNDGVILTPLIPPLEILLYVGHARCRETYNLLVHSLYVGNAIFALVKLKARYYGLEGLHGR